MIKGTAIWNVYYKTSRQLCRNNSFAASHLAVCGHLMLHGQEVLPQFLVLDDVDSEAGGLGGPHGRQDRGLRHAHVLLRLIVLVEGAQGSANVELQQEVCVDTAK